MSKKLIAVASAAALALSVLVGVAPASATAPAATFTLAGANDGSTAALAATVTVARTNAVASTGSGILLNIDDLASGDVVRITATDGVRLLAGTSTLTGSADVDVTKAGVTDINYTHSTATGTTNTTKDYLAYTKSTATGTIVINVVRTGLTYNKTLYLKGVVASDGEYNITNVTGIPATLAALGTAAITFQVTDAFGNAVEDDAEIKAAARVTVGGTAIAAAPTWDATAKVYKASITAPTSGTFIVEITAAATDPSVTGLVDANWKHVAVVNNATVAAQIATLTAQIATMRPKATSVTKKKYNTLARKWNAAFPSQRVALKK